MAEIDSSRENTSMEKIQYNIKRESKLLKFKDINEVEEETTYFIKFNKSRLNVDKKYILETPITYFRIPENNIQLYKENQERKAKLKLIKKVKKELQKTAEYQEFIEALYKRIEALDIDKALENKNLLDKNIKKILDSYEDIKRDLQKEKIKTDKNSMEIKSIYEKIENHPNYQKIITDSTLGPLDIKDLKTLLLETKSNTLYEKIIWCFIFEKIFNIQSSNFEFLHEYIKIEFGRVKKETKIKKIKENMKKFVVSDVINEEIKNINIREFIEESGNFEKIIDYPHSKRKVLIHHNSSYKSFLLPSLILSSFFLYIPLFLTLIGFLNIAQIEFWFILALLLPPFSIIFGFILLNFTDAKKTLMKGDKLKVRFVESINHFLILEENSHENLQRKLFLDSLSEILFIQIYQRIFNDLDKCIRDYKSFNPISIKISFEDNELFPVETSYEGFFHKTSVPLYLDNIPDKDEYSLRINTTRTIRKNRKVNRMINKELIRTKKMFFPFFIILIIMLLIFFGSEVGFVLDLIYYLFLLTIVYILFPFIFIKIKYNYFSSIKTIGTQDKIYSQSMGLFLYKKWKNFFPIALNLREDCSYYITAYAPQFHKIRFVNEMNDLLKKIYTKFPSDLSSTIISFNIPRKRKVDKELEFDIDLEIPKTASITCWILGILIMLALMAFSGIFYFISIVNPSILKTSIDFSTLRFVLTFLTLLIGFFGRDIFTNPTKDLHFISSFLIVCSIAVGVIFILPILYTFFF